MGNTQITEAIIVDGQEEDIKIVEAQLVEENTFDEANQFLQAKKEKFKQEEEKRLAQEKLEKERKLVRQKNKETLDKLRAARRVIRETKIASNPKLAKNTANGIFNNIVDKLVNDSSYQVHKHSFVCYRYEVSETKKYVEIKLKNVQKLFDKIGFKTSAEYVTKSRYTFNYEGDFVLTISWKKEDVDDAKYEQLTSMLNAGKERGLAEQKKKKELEQREHERNTKYLASRAKNPKFYDPFYKYIIKSVNEEDNKGKKEIILNCIYTQAISHNGPTGWTTNYTKDQLVEYNGGIVQQCMNRLNKKGFRTIMHKKNLHIFWDEMEYEKAKVKLFQDE